MKFYIPLRDKQSACLPQQLPLANQYRFRSGKALTNQTMMRINLTLLFLTTIFFQLSFAGIEQKVTLSEKNVSLERVFKIINNQTGYRFLYTDQLLSDAKPIDIEIKNASLNEVLKYCFEGQPLTYVIKNTTVIVQRKPAPLQAKQIASGSIKGKVTDAKGESLLGVTIKLEGTATQTKVTDVNGNYAFSNLPAGNYSISYTFVGFSKATKEVKLSDGEESSIDVTLQEESSKLNEVVVVGYGTQRKREITGAVSSISEEKLKALPVSRFEQAIQGRVAGVNVTSNSGAPGGAVSVRIRGIGTIGSNQPLFIIDGIPVFGDGALNTISASDIQSMEILKDAAATAIYGARAANGVVIVTTKRGKEGKVAVSYDAYTGMQQLARKYDMLNSSQYAQLSNEMRSARRTDPLTPEWGNPSNIPGGVDTDWQSEIFRTAPMQNHSLSLSGGGQNSQYVLSGNYFDQGGTVKSSNFKRYSLRVNTDAKVWNRVKIGTSLLFARTDENLTGGAVNVDQALRALPTVPVKLADGAWGGPQGAKELYNDVANPVALINLNNVTNGRYRFLGNVFGEVEILKDLSYKISYSSDLSMQDENGFRPTYQMDALFLNTASLEEKKSRANTHIWENILNYSHTFKEKHKLSLLGVYSAQVTSTSFTSANVNGLISNELPYLRAFDPNGTRNINSEILESALLSYTARANYAFNDKYLFSATIRRDGSSKFGKNYPFANFPAFSAGWRMSEESFMQGMGFINDLKLRGSWGKSGNQEIGEYPFASVLNNTKRYVFGTAQTVNSGITPTTLANPDVRWETSTQTNIGIDAGLFGNRVDFSANYYVKNTTDMLVQLPLPLNSGIAPANFPYVNAGSVKNNGIELELSYKHGTSKGIRYQVGINGATVNNKVTSLGAGQPIFSGNFLTATNGRGGQNVTITRVGDPIGSFYGYISDGIFQNQQEITAHAVQSATATKPGDMRFKDINEDKIINANDRVLLGNPIPDFTYALNGSVAYKNFDLSIFFQGVQGNEIYNGTRTRIAGMFAVENQTTEVLERWRGEGTSNTIPRAVDLDPAENGRNSSRWVEDGSYFRLKNLALGYNLPKGIAERVKFRTARVYVSGTNLLTFTKYTGLDPEIGERGQNALFSGIDDNIYPVSRTFTLGLNMNF